MKFGGHHQTYFYLLQALSLSPSLRSRIEFIATVCTGGLDFIVAQHCCIAVRFIITAHALSTKCISFFYRFNLNFNLNLIICLLN